MEDAKKHLESLSEIRNLMERSTKFISLSGMSGVVAGLAALVGSWMAHHRLQEFFGNASMYSFNEKGGRAANYDGLPLDNLTYELIGIALGVLLVSIVAGILLTLRESRKQNQKLWDKNSQLLFANLFIPLAAGGLFALILVYHGWFILVAPVTLIFYGLALINASKYTLSGVRYLGMTQLFLGLLSTVFLGRGLLFWAVGFGVVHIIYGTVMHFRYNRKTTV